MDALNHLFALVDAYRAHTGLAETTVSRCVLKNGNRLRDLRARTTDIGIYRVETAAQWFSDNWPVGLDWPAGVPRPSATQPAPQPAAHTPEAA